MTDRPTPPPLAVTLRSVIAASVAGEHRPGLLSAVLAHPPGQPAPRPAAGTATEPAPNVVPPTGVARTGQVLAFPRPRSPWDDGPEAA